MNNIILDQTFTNHDFSNQKIPGTEYDNCSFVNCDFTEANLSVVLFLECTFIDCNFTQVMMKQASFRDACVFENCKLLGANFSSCNAFMFSVEFKACVLDYASFYGFELKNILFAKSKLIGVDFTEATITGSVFNNCDLSTAIFDQTNAEKVDFRTAINFDIDPTNNRLKKATFSKDNMKGLLKKFDLIIE
ncbi:pentapeptide repeat-containing protein [Aquimarina sp. AD1]|uniref:pentapeptide repeat-containing protein n=1 Tax=Aquimarina sp. (strain AD1) TaxID=1714848 RepID=UPI000E4A0FB4|nr:pentapeptide repeat-containing protein [Aquimarina sp. AD1]AXT55006.1 pentapeptide repeat-containing protein [Aquimarina sp. AD1]RKN19526.1 pentapeptide repeat-containing protein [Aquimarina sp. AD1]